MADALLIDRMFQRIMRGLVDTGRAPHHAELARALGLGCEEGRLLLHDLMRAYPIGWLHPETDYIAACPPLNNLPTQYRIAVRGEQRWFAQCGFEATSATWLVPGETGARRRPVSRDPRRRAGRPTGSGCPASRRSPDRRSRRALAGRGVHRSRVPACTAPVRCLIILAACTGTVETSTGNSLSNHGQHRRARRTP